MERALTHVASAGGGGGSSGGSVASTVSREEEEHCSNSNVGLSSHEASSSYIDEAEIELGLGLSLGGVVSKQQGPRILTAKDLPRNGLRALKSSPPSASSSSASSLGEVNLHHGFSPAGTKRAAETSPTRISQAVGWPPIRASRMNSMSNQVKAAAAGEINSDMSKNEGKGLISNVEESNKANPKDKGHLRGSLFVKVNMDGIGIGRKVDLSRHSTYESLAQILEDMFTIPSKSDTSASIRGECGVMSKAKRASKLLDGLSDFVLTYEDKDGDWMLVGDVPWGLFISSVKRLRIMKKSEANGLDQ
ncbi:hypothetical protein V2J09_016033 [Rumex salicifolius]